VRTALSLLLVVGLAGSLAACTTAETPNGSKPGTASTTCEPTASGSVSDSIKVTGDFGAKPTAEFTAPLKVTDTERSVVIEGDGEQVTTGDKVNVDITLYNATTGEVATATEYNGKTTTPFTIGETGLLTGITKTLDCSTVGSRVVGAINVTDGFGETGSEGLAIAATDPLVFVVDVVSIVPPLEVEAYADMKDMPTVEFADDNEPTITIPDIDPPTDTRIGVIKEGDGDVVGAGADVTVQYRGVNWATGKEFDSSWSRGEATSFNTAQVVNGFRAAIEGQKIGSTVISVVAPVDGYGATGSQDGAISPTDTMVFVIDIVSVTPAATE